MYRPSAKARRLWHVVALILLAIAWDAVPARALDVDQIYLNEAVIRGVGRLELYNRSPSTIDLSFWTIQGSLGTMTIPPGTLIHPGEYRVFDGLVGIFDPIGGEIWLLDLVGHGGDRVFYGNRGSAPLPHDAPDVSLARAPDAFFGPLRDPGPTPSGAYWTIDFNSTFGRRNNAKNPLPGGSMVINEVSPALPPPPVAGVSDIIELYNPTAAPVSTAGWMITVGTGIATSLGSIVPSGGVEIFPLAPGTFAETAQLVYLFDADTVRVDQVGWFIAPPRPEGSCYARCPDGVGPNLGFDWVTTAGFFNWFIQPCTLDLLNAIFCDGAAGVPDPNIQVRSWGRIKQRYQR